MSERAGVHRAGCSKRPSSKAAASEEARRTLRYVEPLSVARTPLADFFSILLEVAVIDDLPCPVQLMELEQLSREQVLELNIPTGAPLLYELDRTGKVVDHRYL